MSLSSNSYSSHSASSTKLRHQALSEKIAECETFRDILCRQIETLQGYFDTCSTIATSLESNSYSDNSKQTVADLMKQHGHHAVDFKGEAITFKATTAGILATLQYCTELMGQREEQLKKKLEKEQILRRQAEEKLRRLEAPPGDMVDGAAIRQVKKIEVLFVICCWLGKQWVFRKYLFDSEMSLITAHLNRHISSDLEPWIIAYLCI